MSKNLLGLVCGAWALWALAACGSDVSGEVQQEETPDPPALECDDSCPNGTQRVEDSANRCGFRCEEIALGGGGGFGGVCDRPCGEGFERRVAPQSECGFTCAPVRREDGSSFNPDFQDPPDAPDAPEDVAADVSEDVPEDVPGDVPEDVPGDADASHDDATSDADGADATSDASDADAQAEQ
jgi:hypothetical protein